jgi:hypothetical protein
VGDPVAGGRFVVALGGLKSRGGAMTIAANSRTASSFPLEDVKLAEGNGRGARARGGDIQASQVRAGTAHFPDVADRDDIPDGVAHENRIRRPRY